MPLRIAFDLDGVLADMEAELVRQAELIFGAAMTRRLQEGPPSGQPSASTGRAQETDPGARSAADRIADTTPPLLELRMTPRQQRRLWRHVESIESFWETLEEIEPGAVARLAEAAASRRWEIIFLTKRPESAGATAQVQTQRWLEAKGFRLPSVYVVQGSRGRIAAALDLDIVIDDRPENCLDVVVDSKARTILVWREDESLLPVAARRLGIGVVKTVAECLDILEQIDTSEEEQPGLMARVKRLLGLTEAEGAGR
ncbi:MAG: hypothetical protein IT176_07930 [Acidobacteria bacterium]|nr:hypothetical protein [Acidobacteriota bacterium]